MAKELGASANSQCVTLVKNLGDICGLNIESTAQPERRRNEPQAITFRAKRPMNIVFHGHHDTFKYDYYGIHRGTEDRLTFVGPLGKLIRANFIDCRGSSQSWGTRYETSLVCGIDRVHVIPPGVAHTFDGLEDVYTLNSFRNFLPDPNAWFRGSVAWNLSADTINLPRDVSQTEVPRISPNEFEASDVFYQTTSRNLENNADGQLRQYPHTRLVHLPDGSTRLLRFKKTEAVTSRIPDFKRVRRGISGLGWRRRIVIIGGAASEAGYTVMNGPNDFALYHGRDESEEIALSKSRVGRGKWITILGASSRRVEVIIGTAARRVRLLVEPSPYRDLVVPPGVSCVIRHVKDAVVVVKRPATFA